MKLDPKASALSVKAQTEPHTALATAGLAKDDIGAAAIALHAAGVAVTNATLIERLLQGPPQRPGGSDWQRRAQSAARLLGWPGTGSP